MKKLYMLYRTFSTYPFRSQSVKGVPGIGIGLHENAEKKTDDNMPTTSSKSRKMLKHKAQISVSKISRRRRKNEKRNKQTNPPDCESSEGKRHQLETSLPGH